MPGYLLLIFFFPPPLLFFWESSSGDQSVLPPYVSLADDPEDKIKNPGPAHAVRGSRAVRQQSSHGTYTRLLLSPSHPPFIFPPALSQNFILQCLCFTQESLCSPELLKKRPSSPPRWDNAVLVVSSLTQAHLQAEL